MRRAHRPRRRPGFLLLEVLIGIGVLGVFLGGIGLTLLLGQEHTIMGADRIHAVHRAQEALEAASALRDDTFDALLPWTDGMPHGVRIGAGGTWTIAPDPVTDTQGFRTTLTLTSVAVDHVSLRAETTWQRGYNRSGAVLLTMELTNWRAPPAIGDWETVIVQGSGSVAGMTPMFTAAALYREYLFATSEEGDGLYVIDLSSLSHPQAVASVDLGEDVSGLDLVIRGDRLYVLTDDASAEIKVYDIADPKALSSATVPVQTYNLSREGRGRSLTFWENRLLAGTAASPDDGIHELFLVNVTQASPVLLDSLNVEQADILAMAVSGTSALLATSDHSAELQAVDVRSSLLAATSEGYNATGDVPGRSIATANGVVVLGRSGLHGLTRLAWSPQGFVAPVTPPPTHDVGGDVNGLDMDASACVAFAAVGGNGGGVEFQAVRLGGSMTGLGYLNRDTGEGRAVAYDRDRDRAYLLTDDAWYVLRPGPGTLTCP